MAIPTTRPARRDTGSRSLSAGIAGASGYAGASSRGSSPGIRSSRSRPRRRAPRVSTPSRRRHSRAATSPSSACPTGPAAVRDAIAGAGTPVVDLGSDFRLEAELGLRAHRALPAGRARLAPDREPGLLRDRRDARARAAGRGRAAGRAASRSTASPASRGRSRADRVHARERDRGRRSAVQATGHRHIAEIERSLARLAGEPVPVTFTPHYAPHSRGLEVTCYARLRRPLTQAEADALFRARYDAEPFVSVEERVHPGRLHGANAATSESGSTSARRRRSARRRSTISSRARPGRPSRTRTSCSASTRAPG